MRKSEDPPVNNSIIFTSEAMNIAVDRERRDLEYILNVPLMVFRNQNTMIKGKPDYGGYFYTPPNSVFPNIRSLDVTKLRTYMRHPDYFEFMFLFEGEFEEKINEKINTYKPGCCRIAYKNTRHLEKFDKDFSAVYFCISSEMVNRIRAYDTTFFADNEKDMIDPVLARFIGLSANRTETSIADYLVFTPQHDRASLAESVEQIALGFKSAYENAFYGSTFLINSLFGRLLTLLSDRQLYAIDHIQLSSSSDAALFNRISGILFESKGRTSRSQMESIVNYSGSYISRIVKKYSGKTLFDYSMIFLMEEAVDLLKHSNMSISDIAFDLGFLNRTHFYNQFKKIYNVTPNEFRRINRG